MMSSLRDFAPASAPSYGHLPRDQRPKRGGEPIPGKPGMFYSQYTDDTESRAGDNGPAPMDAVSEASSVISVTPPPTPDSAAPPPFDAAAPAAASAAPAMAPAPAPGPPAPPPVPHGPVPHPRSQEYDGYRNMWFSWAAWWFEFHNVVPVLLGNFKDATGRRSMRWCKGASANVRPDNWEAHFHESYAACASSGAIGLAGLHSVAFDDPRYNKLVVDVDNHPLKSGAKEVATPPDARAEWQRLVAEYAPGGDAGTLAVDTSTAPGMHVIFDVPADVAARLPNAKHTAGVACLGTDYAEGRRASIDLLHGASEANKRPGYWVLPPTLKPGAGKRRYAIRDDAPPRIAPVPAWLLDNVILPAWSGANSPLWRRFTDGAGVSRAKRADTRAPRRSTQVNTARAREIAAGRDFSALIDAVTAALPGSRPFVGKRVAATGATDECVWLFNDAPGRSWYPEDARGHEGAASCGLVVASRAPEDYERSVWPSCLGHHDVPTCDAFPAWLRAPDVVGAIYRAAWGLEPGEPAEAHRYIAGYTYPDDPEFDAAMAEFADNVERARAAPAPARAAAAAPAPAAAAAAGEDPARATGRAWIKGSRFLYLARRLIKNTVRAQGATFTPDESPECTFVYVRDPARPVVCRPRSIMTWLLEDVFKEDTLMRVSLEYTPLMTQKRFVADIHSAIGHCATYPAYKEDWAVFAFENGWLDARRLDVGELAFHTWEETHDGPDLPRVSAAYALAFDPALVAAGATAATTRCPLYEAAWAHHDIGYPEQGTVPAAAPGQARTIDALVARALLCNYHADGWAVMMHMFGDARTGKSTIMDLIGLFAGDGNVRTISHETFWGSSSAHAGRCVFLSEGDGSVHTYVKLDTVKRIISNEMVNVPRKGMPALDVLWHPMLVATSNHMPSYNDGTDAMADRVAVIHMNAQYMDPTVPPVTARMMFEREGPAILARVLLAYGETFAAIGRGRRLLSVPGLAATFRRAYEQAVENPLADFLRADSVRGYTIDTHPTALQKMTSLAGPFLAHCETVHIKNPPKRMSQTAFKRAIAAAGLQSVLGLREYKLCGACESMPRCICRPPGALLGGRCVGCGCAVRAANEKCCPAYSRGWRTDSVCLVGRRYTLRE